MLVLWKNAHGNWVRLHPSKMPQNNNHAGACFPNLADFRLKVADVCWYWLSEDPALALQNQTNLAAFFPRSDGSQTDWKKNGTLTEKTCVKIPGVFFKKTPRQCERKVKLGLVERNVLKEIEKQTHPMCFSKRCLHANLYHFLYQIRFMNSKNSIWSRSQGKDQTHVWAPIKKWAVLKR